MGDDDVALALSAEACARFPLVSAVWLARADALLAAGCDDEALRTVEQAVRVDSLSVSAVSRLANLCVRAGEAARAKDVLGRAIGRLPASALLRVQLAELAWSSGERTNALAGIEAVLALEGEHEDAWRLLDRWSIAKGAETGKNASDVLARIESLSASRPWSAHAALNVARARAQRDDIAGALAATVHALELDPRFHDALDFRVILLALLGRFDDAEKACAPAVLVGAVSRELRGRAAWVRARRGDLDGACAAMRALLDENLDYVWGWNELTRWERQRGASEELVEAAKHLVAAAPRSPGAYRIRANALLERGDRAAARRTLERGAALAANDEDLRGDLFERYLEDDAFEGAEALVPRFRAGRPATALACEARLFAQRRARDGGRDGDGDRAIEAFAALAVDPGADSTLIDDAHRACVLGGLAQRAEAVVADLLADDAAHGSIGGLWVRGRLGRGDLAGVATAMRSLDPKRVVVRAAALQWLSLLRERREGEAVRDAARLVRQRFTPCDDVLWAEVAASLLHGAWTECVTWTADWRDRTSASAWMLLNVASALRESARVDEAYEVVQHAARLPEDVASRSHKTWLAFELALRGEAAESRQWLARAGDLTGAPLLECVATMTSAVLVAREAGRSLSGFARARGLLARANANAGASVLRLAYGRALRRVASEAGFLGTLWSHRRALRTVALVAAIAAGIVLVLVNADSIGTGVSGISGLPGLTMFMVFGLRAFLRQSGQTSRQVRDGRHS